MAVDLRRLTGKRFEISPPELDQSLTPVRHNCEGGTEDDTRGDADSEPLANEKLPKFGTLPGEDGENDKGNTCTRGWQGEPAVIKYSSHQNREPEGQGDLRRGLHRLWSTSRLIKAPERTRSRSYQREISCIASDEEMNLTHIVEELLSSSR